MLFQQQRWDLQWAGWLTPSTLERKCPWKPWEETVHLVISWGRRVWKRKESKLLGDRGLYDQWGGET